MKFNWKKVLVGSLSAALGLSAFAGGAVGLTQVSAQEPLRIAVDGNLLDYLEANIAGFEEETGITVELVQQDMFESLEGLPLDGPAGLAADVLIAPYDRIGSLGMTGQISEVTLNEDAGFDDTDKLQVTANDTIFGAPAIIESLVMYYNTDLIAEAPTTFEELEVLAEDEAYAFEGEEGKNVAFLAKWTDFYVSYGLISGYGGYVFGQDGTDPTDIGLNNEGAIEGINYAIEWFNRWPQGMLDVTGSGDFVTQSFMDGSTAVIIGGPWDATAFAEAGVNFEAAKIPTLPNGNDYQPFGGGKGWIISNYSTNKEAAQQFLDWVTTEEQQTAMFDMIREVPANQAARAAAAENSDSLTAAVIDTYSSAVPMPNIPEMGEVWPGAENLMFDAASGNKTAEQSANDAVELISQSIEQKFN
ncbi:extracellular solute-binding protein [Fundicoccus culcitae]|uniref:Extracellular solute-binding protein n=1 Tax=Fundicoccus culcitae TaxID=2969821 RepID=A0ABY5P578_9LACT|nr:extracellular solute-binding protein [Fundicoccus culcitae]UUX33909.1 extracellular solute-binding protein [Fundicoccus culcitae]